MGKKQIDVMSPPSDNSRSIETGAFGRPAMGAQPIADPVLKAFFGELAGLTAN